jgi:myo-inositol-1(or 4)-monophosphatase
MDAQELERVALDVASAAAKLIMQGFRQSFAVSTKAGEELFTEYDVRSEELVRRELERRTPGIPIVGEEQGGKAGDDLTWYIDPIDGTINFVAGHPWFAVSLGVMRGKRHVAGAVVAPALGQSWSAAIGHGATKDGAPCKVSSVDTLSQALIATGFPQRRGVSQALSERRALQLGELAARVRDVRRCGSAAVDLCLVGDGTYDAYWMRRLSPWDTAAGVAVVLAAGGKWTELGRAGAEHDIASNGAIDGELRAVVE